MKQLALADLIAKRWNIQLANDVDLNIARGGGSQCNGRRRAKLLSEIADARVVRSKVVSPFADAMRLIHRKQFDFALLKHGDKLFFAKPLRCNVQK